MLKIKLKLHFLAPKILVRGKVSLSLQSFTFLQNLQNLQEKLLQSKQGNLKV